jgi:hypothetical protein
MNYTVKQIEDQKLAFAITTEHHGKEMTFNVVCANDESEISDLVAHHLAFLDAPPPVYPQQEQTPAPDLQSIVMEQQAIIEQLKADVAALKGAQA